MTTLEQMGAKAKDASRFLMTAGSKKDIALGAIADALCENCEEILAANKIDLENGEKSGLTASLLDTRNIIEPIDSLQIITSTEFGPKSPIP